LGNNFRSGNLNFVKMIHSGRIDNVPASKFFLSPAFGMKCEFSEKCVSNLQQGVSMIELMVGLVIVAILLGIGAPSLGIWIQNGKIRTATEAIQNGLQLARSEAIHRNTSVQFALSGTANVDSSWTIGCVTPVADLNGDGVDDCPANIQSHAGAEGTTNTKVNADVAGVAFSALGRAGSSMTINVTNAAGGSPLRIVVSTGGLIRMCDPSLVYPANPKGC
jgi:type IV fimbrial biogenesis protein FimT